MKMRTMDDLYAHLLRDIYYAENQLIKALPKLAKAATHAGLKTALQAHLLETKVQAERLEQIFKLSNLPVRGEKCDGMDGLIDEAKTMMGRVAIDIHTGPAIMDATIIAACRKIEHYEAGSYRTLVEIAKMLGRTDHIRILRNILKEEKTADATLAELALLVLQDDRDGDDADTALPSRPRKKPPAEQDPS